SAFCTAARWSVFRRARMAGSLFCALAFAKSIFSPGVKLPVMPLATACGSAFANKAISALVEGSRVLDGGAPGNGGRRLKSGGMTSGALVVTANSSGDFLTSPAALRRESQPLNTLVQRHKARAACRNFILDLVRRWRMLGLEHIVNDRNSPQRNGHV